MNNIITGFSDIKAGWMKMHIYDYRTEEEREMRISYLQPFFDDLLMACKFLLSDITGIYELYIDQEGFEANIRFYKYQNEEISIELNEDFFEDEVLYNGTNQDWEDFHNQEIIPTSLSYFNVNIESFVKRIIVCIEMNKEEYNTGFVLSPSEQLNVDLFNEVKQMLYNIEIIRSEHNEKISNT